MSRFVVREELKCTEWFLAEADTAEEVLEKFENGGADRNNPMDEFIESRYPEVPVVVERQFD